jgi:hypothetical protein
MRLVVKFTWDEKLVDHLYRKPFTAGDVQVSGYDDKDGANFGLPHMMFVADGVEVSVAGALPKGLPSGHRHSPPYQDQRCQYESARSWVSTP